MLQRFSGTKKACRKFCEYGDTLASAPSESGEGWRRGGEEEHFVETALGVGMGVGSGDSIGKKALRMGESDSKGCPKVMSRLTKTQSQRECHLSCGSWDGSQGDFLGT